MSGERHGLQPAQAVASASTLVESRFIPQRYEPNYAYPMLVMLHGRGGDEQQLLRALPAVSWRNYVGLGLRGPEVLHRDDRPLGFGWGSAYARPRRHSRWKSTPDEPAGQAFRRAFESPRENLVDNLDDAIFETIRTVRRSLHVHSERIFLVGTGEGAAVAFRLGLSYPDRFAGIVALNGWLPARVFRAPVRLEAIRSLRILSIHGQWNSRIPITQARRDIALLRSAGLRVAFQSYPCANRLTFPMLADVDTWLMHQCTASF